jgi:hypothetical protein
VRLGVHARGKRRGIFYSRREAVGTFLACQGKWSLGKDRSMAEVRRGVGGGVRRPSANGGARAAGCGRCAGATWLGHGPANVVHRD